MPKLHRLWLAVALLPCACAVNTTPVAPPSVRHQVFRAVDFSSFLNNTVGDPQSLRVLLNVRSRAQWDELFGVAMYMGQTKPHGPDATLYEKQQLLVVARDIPRPPTATTLLVESVRPDASVLHVYYRYKELPPSTATYRDYIAIAVPREGYSQARFYENGVEVGQIPLGDLGPR